MLYFRTLYLLKGVSNYDEFRNFLRNELKLDLSKVTLATISQGNIKHHVFLDDHSSLYLKHPERSVYGLQCNDFDEIELPANTESDAYLIEIFPLGNINFIPYQFDF